MNMKHKNFSVVFLIVFLLSSLSACSNQNVKSSVTSISETLISENQTTVTYTSKESEHSETTTDKNSDTTTEVTDSDISVEDNYEKAIELLKSEKFQDAQALFEKCGDYKLSSELVNVCKAELYFDVGGFDKATEFYKNVSKSTEVTGFGVQRRKANLATRINLSEMSGLYFPVSNTIDVKRTKNKKKLRTWYSTGIWNDQKIKFTYTINTDGSLNITGSVRFGRFTNYTNKKTGIKTGSTTIPINLQHVDSFPKKLKIANGVTLTHKNGKFVVNYKKTIKSGKTITTYRSIVTYSQTVYESVPRRVSAINKQS